MPLILQGEVDKLKQEIYGKCVSIMFDVTTNVCKAFVVVLTLLVLKQQVCRLMLLAKSITTDASPTLTLGICGSPQDGCPIRSNEEQRIVIKNKIAPKLDV